jgi:hypothetical protein
MKKIIILFIGLMIVMGNVLVGASGGHEETFDATEEIIMDKIPCERLTLDQLEDLGDYYMEQMHPGELHEVMDERMGGEGSASLRQVHINMGKAFYCGEHGVMSRGMMNMMMNRDGLMAGQGMMGSSSLGNNMMDSYRVNYGYFWIFWILIIVVLILLIVWLIKQLQKPVRRHRRR